jgi:hypothetical protein
MKTKIRSRPYLFLACPEECDRMEAGLAQWLADKIIHTWPPKEKAKFREMQSLLDEARGIRRATAAAVR